MITDTRIIRRGAAPDRRWAALFVVSLATFMDLVDVTIVNVALPTVQSDLRAGYAAGQWMVAGYALAYALLLITGGRLGDIEGRRRVFLAGVTGFTVASVLGGTAVSPEILIAARIAQGACAGVMVPQVLALITVRFAPGRARTAAFGVYGVMLGVAQVSGPILGGLLTELDLFGLGWRTIFFINVPIGLVAVAGAARWLDDDRGLGPGGIDRFDPVGIALTGAVTVLLTYPLIQGRALGWPVWSLIMPFTALPALAALMVHERRRERHGLIPLIPTGLFALRQFSAGLALTLVLFSAVSAVFIVLTWGLQFGLGWSPLHMALTGLAWPAGVACTAQLTHRYGHGRARLLVGTGTFLSGAGTLAFIAVVAAHGEQITSAVVMPCLVLSGVGLGMTLPVLSNAVLGGVPAARAGAASGLFNSITQLGGALGVAVAGVLFFGGAEVVRARAATPAMPSFDTAMPRALWYCAAAFLAATALAMVLPRRIRVDGATAPHVERDPYDTNEPGGAQSASRRCGR